MVKNLFLFVFGVLFFASCTKNETEIPQVVQRSLDQNYPTAEEVSWIQLTDEIYEAEFKHDQTWKLADFDLDGKIRSVQTDNNVDGCYDGGDKRHRDTLNLSIIPQTVLDSIAAKYPGYSVTKGYVTTHDSITTYLIVVSNGTETVRLVYDANWVLLKVGTGHTGGGHSGGGKGHGGGKGKGHGEGGGKGHGTHIDITTLPASIAAYVGVNYAGFTIHKAKKETYDGVEYYEVLVKDAAGDHKRLLFDLNGTFVKEK